MTEPSTRPAEAPARPDPGHLARREFEVSGMTCGACSSRVQRVLSRLDGVHDAAVNLATHRATVRFDPAVVGPAELSAVVTRAGYGFAPRSDRPESVATAARTMEQHERQEQQRWLARLLVALPITVVVLAMALRGPADPRWGWVPALLTVPVQFWAGWTFLRGAWARALNLSANMDTLVALGTLTAFGWSLLELVTPGTLAATTGHVQHEGHLHFEMVCLIITALLLGKWFESRAKAQAGHAARALAELAPESAVRLDSAQDDEGTRVRVEDVLPGDLVLVRPGDRVAIDGVVVDGLSTVDESLLTGESAPVEKSAGASVTGGTVNLSGRLVVRTTRVGAESTLSRLVDLVEQAQGAKAPLQRLADRIAGLFVPVVLVLAALTALGWTLLDQPATGVLSAVAVLIVACPCALGLATPVALMVAGGRGSTLGVVLRNPEALELNSRIDTVVFDKTGVLTSGLMQVTEQWVRPGENAAVALARTAAAEAATEHPAGTAVLRHARAADLVLPVASAFEAVPGHGVRASVEELDVRVGKPVPVELPDGGPGVQVVEDVVPLDPALAELVAGWQAHGHTTVFATWDGQVRAAFAIADRPRPEAADVIRELHALGLRTALLTGDNLPTARSVAAAVGIDDVLADVLPADKDARIAELQARGHVVAMVGDGINDAAALARADLGIAVGSGTDVAARASDVVLLGDNLHGVPRAVRLSRRTFRVILQNLGWAFGYNLVAIPLAATGLLSPALAGVAMGLSSICVVGNSLTLTRFDRRPVAARAAAGAGTVARPPSRFSASVLAAWLAPALLLGGLVLANPARYLGAPTVDRTFTLAQDTVQLSIGPLQAGNVPLHLYAFSAQGGLDATARPTVQAHPTSGTGPIVTAVLVPAGPGHLSGTIALTKGTWDLVITDPASGAVRHEVLVQVS